jgi:hypothetical protein
VFDSDLRQALLGTGQLISYQIVVDGALTSVPGDDPQGYLVYTPNEHVFVQMATRAERGRVGPEILQLRGPQAVRALGFGAYCGRFEVRDGQVIHHGESGSFPRISGTVEPRSVSLDGDRLILSTPVGVQLEWQRIL